MPRTIIIPEEELDFELKSQYAKGMTHGRVQIINAVKAILAGRGEEVIVADSTETEIKDFISELKNDERFK